MTANQRTAAGLPQQDQEPLLPPALQAQISTRHLPAGLYLLQCIDEQGIRFTEKLVIGRP
jgi:hypothetical protein